MLHEATERLDALRATLRWAFDDGEADEADQQLASLDAEAAQR